MEKIWQFILNQLNPKKVIPETKVINNTPSLNCESSVDQSSSPPEYNEQHSNNFVAGLLLSRILDNDRHSHDNNRSDNLDSASDPSSENSSQDGFGGGFGGGEFGGGGAGSSW